jgi:alpha/beta superfamily hydrolase
VLTIPGPAGPLAALLDLPAADRGTHAALFCHPHPEYGGTMHNKVVYRAARAARDQGIPTLRFNFRGVGGRADRSAGIYDGGRGEADDARSALAFLAERFPGRGLIAGGFSFGAWVAVRVGAADERVAGLIAIGTATAIFGSDFLGAVAKPALFVQGTEDRFGPIVDLAAALATLPAGVARMARVEGAEHLFTGHEGEVYAAVRAFLIELTGSTTNT